MQFVRNLKDAEQKLLVGLVGSLGFVNRILREAIPFGQVQHCSVRAHRIGEVSLQSSDVLLYHIKFYFN